MKDDDLEQFLEDYKKQQHKKYTILTVLSVIAGAVIGNLIGHLIFYVIEKL